MLVRDDAVDQVATATVPEHVSPPKIDQPGFARRPMDKLPDTAALYGPRS